MRDTEENGGRFGSRGLLDRGGNRFNDFVLNRSSAPRQDIGGAAQIGIQEPRGGVAEAGEGGLATEIGETCTGGSNVAVIGHDVGILELAAAADGSGQIEEGGRHFVFNREAKGKGLAVVGRVKGTYKIERGTVTAGAGSENDLVPEHHERETGTPAGFP